MDFLPSVHHGDSGYQLDQPISSKIYGIGLRMGLDLELSTFTTLAYTNYHIYILIGATATKETLAWTEPNHQFGLVVDGLVK